MNLKEILEKEFESDVDIKENHHATTYIIHDYNRIGIVINDYTIRYVYYLNSNLVINSPIYEIYWLIYCIKNIKSIDNLQKMFLNKALKREFTINTILNN